MRLFLFETERLLAPTIKRMSTSARVSYQDLQARFTSNTIDDAERALYLELKLKVDAFFSAKDEAALRSAARNFKKKHLERLGDSVISVVAQSFSTSSRHPSLWEKIFNHEDGPAFVEILASRGFDFDDAVNKLAQAGEFEIAHKLLDAGVHPQSGHRYGHDAFLLARAVTLPAWPGTSALMDESVTRWLNCSAPSPSRAKMEPSRAPTTTPVPPGRA